MSKKTAKLLLSGLCLLLVVSCSAPEKDKQIYYEKAMEFVKQEKQEAAVLELRSAIQIDAKFAEARYQLGLLYLQGGETKKAFAELVRAGDLNPDNLDANLKVAHFYLLSRKKEEARKRIELILAKDPNYRDALVLLANLELSEGKYEEALTALGRIGAESETSDELLNIRGRILAAQQQWDAAEEVFRRAIAANEDNFVNYETLLLLLQQKKDMLKSKEVLDAIIEKFPDNVKAHLLLAGYYRSIDNKDQVVEELQKVVEIAPDKARFRLQLADFYQRYGKLDYAEKILVQARTDIPDDPDLTGALATLYFEQKKFDEARSMLDELGAGQSGHGGGILLNARFLLKEGKSRDAIVILQKLSNDVPHWPSPQFYLGLAHYSLGEIELAQQAVAGAIQKNGQNSEYHTLLAQIFQEMGAFEEAKAEAVIAVRLSPTDLRAALILSRALISAKQYGEAVAILVDMRKQIPAHSEILGNLILAYFGAGDRQKGEEILTELLRIDPGNTHAVALFLDLRFKNDLPGAEAFVRQQIDKAPADARLHLILGSLLEKQNNGRKALAAYEKAQELGPDMTQPYLAAARIMTKLGQRDEARAKYNDLIAKDPKSVPGHMGIATLLQAEGNSPEAAAQYRKIVDINRNYAPAANNLAWLIASDPNGDLGEALMIAMTAKQSSPDDPNIADTLGWVHYQRHSYMLATSQFELALQSQPDNPTWTYHLALAQNGDNKKEAAIQTLDNLLKKSPAFPDRQKALDLLAELTKG